MENNDWIVLNDKIFDLECSAYGKELKIISKDRMINFSMRFEDIPLGLSILNISENNTRFPLTKGFLLTNNERVPVWRVRGRLKWGKAYVDIRDFEVEDLLRKNIIRGGAVGIQRSVLKLNKDGSLYFG